MIKLAELSVTGDKDLFFWSIHVIMQVISTSSGTGLDYVIVYNLSNLLKPVTLE